MRETALNFREGKILLQTMNGNGIHEENNGHDGGQIRKTHVLVTGGAGYIGSVLVPLLLQKDYKVTVYDLFVFGAESLFSCSFSPDLNIIKGDVCDEEHLKNVLQHNDIDAVIHLAAIVGYPACQKDPDLATRVNIDGTRNVVHHLLPHQKLVFASTGSCYVSIKSGFCTEETPLNPLSLYATSKAVGEELVMKEVRGVCLRLATIFGCSQRLRLDLLINDLVNTALTKGKIELYEAHFRRTFLHVRDVARSFVMALERYDEMRAQVFNVGGDSLNYTKLDICNVIKKRLPSCQITLNTMGQDQDKRDYQVSYKKIRAMGFVPEITVEEGIDELVKMLLHVSPEYLERTKNI